MKRNYTFYQTLFFILFSYFVGQSRPLDTGWKAGQLTLWSNAVIHGDLSYNWLAELVMLRQSDGCIRTFSAHQVQEFGWFDFDQSRQRHFQSLANPVNRGQVNPVFYEVWLAGPLPVVRRLRRPHGLFKRMQNRPAQYTDTQVLAQNHDNFTYFAYDDGQFLALDRFYTDIYDPRLATYDLELKHYIRIHNINERSLLGRLVLIDQYNSMARQHQESASVRPLGNLPK